LSAWAFGLWTITFALSTRMPMWAATLVVALVVACGASVLIVGRIRRMKRIHPVPETNDRVDQGERCMDQTSREIEQHIDRTRERLGITLDGAGAQGRSGDRLARALSKTGRASFLAPHSSRAALALALHAKSPRLVSEDAGIKALSR
jgi:hypothetical protein